MAFCLIALGANIGDRHATLAQAVESLAAVPQFSLRARSSWRETKPIGGPAHQGTYLNGAILLETALSPQQVLAALNDFEIALGRHRAERWGPRTIDLDLLLYDELVLHTPRLELPHPRMAFRRFVIEPAAEIAPSMRHPVIGWTLSQLREHLRFAVPYVAVTGYAAEQNATLAAQLAQQTGARLISSPGRGAGTGRSSAGLDIKAEIELLAHRRRLLTWGGGPVERQLAISDFWLEQSRVFVRESCRDSSVEVFADAIRETSSLVVRPKLLVLVDSSVATGAQAEGARNADLGTDQVALITEAQRPGVGPLLHLTNDDATANLAEAAAAIAAMS